MQLRNTTDLDLLVDQLQADWSKNTDPAATLKQLHTHYGTFSHNLLPETASQGNSKATDRALTKCLALVENLARHKDTNLSDLIGLLTETCKKDLKNAGTYICELHPTFISPYLRIIDIIAKREDLNGESLRKLSQLIIHHDQRGQERGREKDGSLVYDLAEYENDNGDKSLLANYLTTLLNLAEAGKINTDVIYNALRTPLRADNNIGTTIVRTYNRPHCFLLLTKLCRFLVPAQMEQLLPTNYGHVYNYSLKHEICNEIEKLQSADEIIKLCDEARDESTALGKFMHLKRGAHECSDTRGANGRLKEIYSRALIRREEEKNQRSKQLAKAPKPIAPPLDESEYAMLFTNADKEEYAKYVRRVSQTYDLSKPDEAGKALRYAAAYARNEELQDLLAEHHVNPDYNTDVGDRCQDATALYLAVEVNNIEGVKLLLQHNANPSLGYRIGTTPLSRAAMNGNVEIVKLLLEHGAYINAITRYKNSALYFAASQGHAEVVELLVEHYCKLYANDINKLVALLKENSLLKRSIEDCKNGSSLLALARLTDFLAEKGVEQSVINSMIPEAYILKNRKLKESLRDAIKALPQDKLINIRNQTLNDPNNLLYKVAHMKRGGLLGKECRHGAGIIADIENIPLAAGNTAFKALLQEYTDSSADHKTHRLADFEAALANGIVLDKNAEDKHDRSCLFALHYAAARNDIPLLKLLLAHGYNPANVRRTSPEEVKGYIADNKDSTRWTQLLAKQPYKSSYGLIPEQVAYLFNHDEAAAILRQHREALEAKGIHEKGAMLAKTAAQPASKSAAPAAVTPAASEKAPLPSHQAPPPPYEEAVKMSKAFHIDVPIAQPVQEQVEQPSEKLYPHLSEPEAAPSDELQQYLEKARLLQSQPEPAPQAAAYTFVVQPLMEKAPPVTSNDPVVVAAKSTYVNPFDNYEIPAQQVAETSLFILEPVSIEVTPATSQDPFTAIDALLSAPAAPKQPAWIEGLNEIDFSQPAPSSTAAMLNQLGDLISFEEPVKPYVNPFDELIEKNKQAAAVKPIQENTPVQLTEEQRDVAIAAQLDALPKAPTGFRLFDTNNQQEEKKHPAALKKQAVAL